MKPLVQAWLFSALAFSIAFIARIYVTVWLVGGVPPSAIGIFRMGVLALGVGLVVQLGYGGLVYFILTRADLWSVWTVALAYVFPVVLFSWAASDTTADIVGTIPWLVFALIVATVSWFFARAAVS